MRRRSWILTALAIWPAVADAQRLTPAEIGAMPLDTVVSTLRGRCTEMATAMIELQRRHPGDVPEVPDCGGMAAAPGGGVYRAMPDAALVRAIADLSADLEALVARGTALQATGQAAVAPVEPRQAETPRGPGASVASVAGTYACTHDYWTGAMPNRLRHSDPVGALTLTPDGGYRWLDDGGTGRWMIAADSTVTFQTGPITDKQPARVTFRRNRTTSQIDIAFADGVDWSCGRND